MFHGIPRSRRQSVRWVSPLVIMLKTELCHYHLPPRRGSSILRPRYLNSLFPPPFFPILVLVHILVPLICEGDQRYTSRPCWIWAMKRKRNSACHHPIEWHRGRHTGLDKPSSLCLLLSLSLPSLAISLQKSGLSHPISHTRTHYVDLGTSEHCSSRRSTPEPHGVLLLPRPVLSCLNPCIFFFFCKHCHFICR